MPSAYHLIAWGDADQEALIRDVASHSSLELLGVGSEHSDAANRLHTSLQVQRIDDVRKAVLHEDADVLWLASAASIDSTTIKFIRERNFRVLSSRPFPPSLGELPAQGEDAAAVRFTPPMRLSDGYRAAMEVLSDFGIARCVNVTMRSGVGQGGLFARLFDAVDVVESLCGEPEVIDAALVSAFSGSANVAENLASLDGHMTINMRFPENRCACVAISDRAGSWFRGVTVLGDNGCLRISDDGFEWIDLQGQAVESHQADEPSTLASQIASHMLRMLSRQDTTDAPPEAARLLAICEAARLSCRTGEGETPRKMMKMLNHV